MADPVNTVRLVIRKDASVRRRCLLLSGFGLMDRRPDALRRRRDVEMGDTPWLESVDHSVGDAGSRTDRGGLTDTLHAHRVDVRRCLGVMRLELREEIG